LAGKERQRPAGCGHPFARYSDEGRNIHQAVKEHALPSRAPLSRLRQNWDVEFASAALSPPAGKHRAA